MCDDVMMTLQSHHHLQQQQQQRQQQQQQRRPMPSRPLVIINKDYRVDNNYITYFSNVPTGSLITM